MKRKEFLSALMNIQSEVNVLMSETLQEGVTDGIMKLSGKVVSKISSWCGGKDGRLGKWLINHLGKDGGAEATKAALTKGVAYGGTGSIAVGSWGLAWLASQDSEDVPAANELIDNSQKANEQQVGSFEKVWNKFIEYFNRMKEEVSNLVESGSNALGGSTNFLATGFGASLLCMLAGYVLYGMQVEGGMSGAVKRAFADAMARIKSASSIGQIVEIVLTPMKMIASVIGESPVGGALFLVGIILFSVMAAGTAIGWDKLFKQQASAEAPAPQAESYLTW